MPWKNGLGFTTEVARFPQAGEHFDWRVSIASVEQDGPFSRFPGHDRILLVLEGAGLILERGGGLTRLGPLESVAFPGDHDTFGRLVAGPIRDFNVITRRGVARARLEVVHGPAAAVVAAGDGQALLYCHAGRASVASSEGEATLGEGATAFVNPPAGALSIEPAARASTLIAVILQGPSNPGVRPAGSPTGEAHSSSSG